MTRPRKIFRTLLLLTLVLSLLLAAVAAFLRSSFITQHLRSAIIEGVEEATGARANIAELHWSWRTLGLELRDFSMHGFEPATGPPLFQSPDIRVRLRILSLLNGEVQVASLIVQRPHFSLSVGPDGKTNIPGPRHPRTPQAIVQGLLDLKLPHVEAVQGVAQINDQRFPVNFTAEHIGVLIQYLTVERTYRFTAQSPALRLGDPRHQFFIGSAQVHADVWRDHATLTSAQFNSPAADLRLSGTLDRFNRPVLDWNLTSTLRLPELSRLLGVSGVTDGIASLTGIGHHDSQTPLFFDGRISASHLGGRLPGLSWRDASLDSRVVADGTGLQLTDLLLSSPLGRFSGRGSLAEYRALRLQGDVSGLALRTVGGFVSPQPLPWSATVAGPVELTSILRPQLADTILNASLHLSPGRDGIPVSGDARFVYRQPGNRISDDWKIQAASFALPNTRLTVAGQKSELATTLDSTNLADLEPALNLWAQPGSSASLPALAANGRAHLEAVIRRLSDAEGSLDLVHFRFQNAPVDHLQTGFKASSHSLTVPALTLDSPWLQLKASGSTELVQGRWTPSSSMQAKGSFTHADLPALLRFAASHVTMNVAKLALTTGTGTGTFAWTGIGSNPQGNATVALDHLTLHGEQLDAVSAAIAIQSRRVTLTNGQLRSAAARLQFSGHYQALPATWNEGQLELVLDSNVFPLSRVHPLLPSLRSLDAQLELHTKTQLSFAAGGLTPQAVEGTATLHQLQRAGRLLGDINTSAHTEQGTVKAAIAATLLGSKLTGQADLQMAQGMPVRGALQFTPVTLNNIVTAFGGTVPASSPLSGSANGDLSFQGPLQSPDDLTAVLHIQNLEVKGPPLQRLGEELVGVTPAPATPTSSEVLLRNTAPVTLTLRNRMVTVQSADLAGRDTHLRVAGTAELAGTQKLDFNLQGGIDLRLLQIPFPEVQIGGQADLSVALRGVLHDPQLLGNVRLSQGRVYSAVLPNGLSDLAGTIRFDQHRATVQDLMAHTGGGTVRFGGFVTYAANGPLVYRLESTGQNIRVRYANGISITGNSQFSLTGTSSQSLLSGGITISRVVLNPSTDIGNILALTSAPAVEVDSSKDYLSRLQMDIHLESAPNLQLDTALSSGVQAEIDLQLRGTPKQPIFLGSIEANEGDIKVFGSRYSINRGQVSFTNPARLEPVLDLDLQTQSRGVTVDITVSGTLNRLNINYRSDPPLQPREIIALLTVGRAPQSTSNQSNVQATNDSSSLQSGANTVLGQAISPLSNRLSKLFGITNIKIDPLVQGITNTPQARLTLEQQISRQITVTYITNLSQTSEQIFRLEYALSSQFSVVALRDDNGEFGIDILYKKRFK